MINYSNKETNKIPEFEIGDKNNKSKFSISFFKFLNNLGIKIIWR